MCCCAAVSLPATCPMFRCLYVCSPLTCMHVSHQRLASMRLLLSASSRPAFCLLWNGCEARLHGVLGLTVDPGCTPRQGQQAAVPAGLRRHAHPMLVHQQPPDGRGAGGAQGAGGRPAQCGLHHLRPRALRAGRLVRVSGARPPWGLVGLRGVLTSFACHLRVMAVHWYGGAAAQCALQHNGSLLTWMPRRCLRMR